MRVVLCIALFALGSVFGSPEEVLSFWFGDLAGPEHVPVDRVAFWFGGNARIDREIRERFEEEVELASDGALDEWKETARGRLALVILLDQLPRSMYRGCGEAFAFDEKAQGLVMESLSLGIDRELYPIERVFFYLPLEHAEDRVLQKLSVSYFEKLAKESGACRVFLEAARQHEEVIAQFDRFPWRNRQLGRVSTAEELHYLRQPKSLF